MADVARPTLGKLITLMGLFVILGMPLVGYLWDTISDLLALDVGATRILIAVPALLLLIGLLVLLYRSILGWTRQV